MTRAARGGILGRVRRAVVLLPLLVSASALGLASSCSGGDTAAGDGGDDGSFGVRPDGDDLAVDGRINRLVNHGGTVLSAVHLRIVYLGEEGVDGPPDVDELVRWMLSSGPAYWGVLHQYGVEAGTLLDSVRVSSSAFFTPGMVSNGLVSYAALEARIAAVLHPELPADGGADAGDDAAVDAGDGDADDGGQPPPPPPPLPDAGALTLPEGDAYVFMLPNEVNVALGTTASHTFQTCIDSGGYHGYDGHEAYAVIPPCRQGRSALAISHELSEMVTEPIPTRGWYSEADVKNAGGEIADICNQPVPQGVDGWFVTQLWSNADGRCMPQ